MPESLGSAQVDIVAELSPLQKGLAQARSETEAALSSMRRDIESFSDQSGRAVEALGEKFKGVLEFAGVGVGLGESIRIIEQNENALARLDSALTATGGAAGYSRQELVRMAEGLQQHSIYAHADIEAVEGLLLRFGNLSHDEFPRALQVTTDLASAMGIDLVTAAHEVGRAMADPERGMMLLQRAGIVLSAQQREQIKDFERQGDLVGAQGVVLDALSNKTRGAAGSMRNTLGGAFTALGHGAEDIIEKFGEGGVSRAVTNTVNQMADGAPTVESWAEWFGKIAGSVLTISRHGFNNLVDQFGNPRARAGRLNIQGGASPFSESDAASNLNDILNREGPGRAMPLHPAQAGPDQETLQKMREVNLAYNELVGHYQEDLNYQQQLAGAYNKSAAEIIKVNDAHAADLAVERAKQEYDKAGLTLTDQQIEKIRQLASADENQRQVNELNIRLKSQITRADQQHDGDLLKVIQDTDGLTDSERKLADQTGLLWQAYDRGLIPSLEELHQHLDNLQHANDDKSQAHVNQLFAQEAGSDINRAAHSLIEMANAGNKGKDALKEVATQFESILKDAEELVVKLAVINPLLNSLGLGGGENGQGLPTLSQINLGGIFGGQQSGALPAPPTGLPGIDYSNQIADSPELNQLLGNNGDMMSWITKLLGQGGDMMSWLGTGLESMFGSLGSSLSGAGAGAAAFFGFAGGGSFDVGGSGGTDSQMVAFRATPGEHVSVGNSASPRGGDGAIAVHVHDHVGNKVSARTESDGHGGRALIIQLDQNLAHQIRTGRSETGRAIMELTGASRAPLQR